MGIIAGIKTAAAKGSAWEHTFTAWVAKEYQLFCKAEPTLVALGDRVFPYVKSAVQIALELEGQPQLCAPAGALLEAIHAKLDTAAGLLYDFGATPTVASSIAEVQQNIGAFEGVAAIKSTAAQDALAKAVNALSALSTALVPTLASTVIPPALTVPVS